MNRQRLLTGLVVVALGPGALVASADRPFCLPGRRLDVVLGDGDLKYLVESVLQERLFFVYCYRRSNENVFRVERYAFKRPRAFPRV